MATSPFEFTATPETSPTFMSPGSLRKFTFPSNGISGTCANEGAAPSRTRSAAIMRFICASKQSGSISLSIEAPDAIFGATARQCGGALGGDAAGVGGDLLRLRRWAAVHGRRARLRHRQRVHPAGGKGADISPDHRYLRDFCPGRQRAD